MFERPIVLWLLIAAPLVIAPGLIAWRRGRRIPAAILSGFRLLLFIALVLILAGVELPYKTAARRMAVVVAMDQSRSIAPDQQAWMARKIMQLRDAMNTNDRIAVLGFGSDVRLLAPLSDPRVAAVSHDRANPNSTDIAGALTTALGMFPASDEKHLVLLSDGNQTEGNALDEAPALSQWGVRVYTAAPPPSMTTRIALTNFEAPQLVRARTSFPLRIDIDSDARTPVKATLHLYGDKSPLGSQTLKLAPGINRFELPYRINHRGAYIMKVKLTAPAPLNVVNSVAETGISVARPPRILVISNSPPTSLIKALKLRDYDVKETGPHGLPLDPRDYLKYQAVIIANVAAKSLEPGTQFALDHYVADYGGGLLVTGESLRDPAFHGSTLEKVLPTDFVPQPPPPSREPIAIYLLIDRSNSMSYDAKYPAVRDGERIRYAKAAALALLNQLDNTDYVGVIAFDSQPYILSHLRPLGEDREQLTDRISRLEPGGGTDFKKSLEIAEQEILASGIPVREVILLTDGDTNRPYQDHVQLMASYARERIPVSTIRIGPDLENLRLLQDFARLTGGIFYRVEDITKLPQLLVHLTHVARNVESHHNVSVNYTSPTSILNGINPLKIPPIEFYAKVDPKQGAAVPMFVHNGNKTSPLLATWQYELGRTAVFAADPDSMGSVAWIKWDRYAQFWSQLISWVAREGNSGMFNLKVSNAADGSLHLQAEKADTTPVNDLFCRISGPSRAVDVAMTQTAPSVYSGDSPPLPRGKYNVSLMVKGGDTERVFLRREIAVVGSQGPAAAELRLRPPDFELLRRLASETGGAFDAPVAQILKHRGATVTSYRSLDPMLIPLVILLVLGEVLVRRRFLGD